MGNDGVIVCYYRERKGTGILDNESKSTGTLVAWNPPYADSVVLPDSHMLLVNPHQKYENGILACEFTLRQITKIPNPQRSPDGQTYNLSRPYYLQLAKGALETRPNLRPGYHGELRMTSQEKVYLNRTTRPDPSPICSQRTECPACHRFRSSRSLSRHPPSAARCRSWPRMAQSREQRGRPCATVLLVRFLPEEASIAPQRNLSSRTALPGPGSRSPSQHVFDRKVNHRGNSKPFSSNKRHNVK